MGKDSNEATKRGGNGAGKRRAPKSDAELFEEKLAVSDTAELVSAGSAAEQGNAADSLPTAEHDNPAQHVNGEATAATPEHVAKLRALHPRDLVGIDQDATFVGRIQGISTDFKRVLVSVEEPGLSPHRRNANVWLSAASVHSMSEKRAAATHKSNKRLALSADRDNENVTPEQDQSELEDSTMAKSSKKSATASSKKATTKAAATSKRAATTQSAPKLNGKKGVLSGEALDALPQALRAGIEATRLNWASDKWAAAKTLRFANGASAGGYKAAGQVWGHIEVADAEFSKFWRFHYQQKGDKFVVNRTLAYDSAESAQNAAKQEAVALGVKEPEHFAFKF